MNFSKRDVSKATWPFDPFLPLWRFISASKEHSLEIFKWLSAFWVTFKCCLEEYIRPVNGRRKDGDHSNHLWARVSRTWRNRWTCLVSEHLCCRVHYLYLTSLYSQQKCLELPCPWACFSSCPFVRRVTSPTVPSVERGQSWMLLSERFVASILIFKLENQSKMLLLCQIEICHVSKLNDKKYR